MSRSLFLVPAVAALLGTAAPARACDCDHDASAHATAAARPAVRLAAAEAAPTGQAQLVKMAVTQDGFVPAEVKVKAGQPVTLEVTRIVQATCATEIVMKDFGINQPLPLDKKVTVTFTPKKKGDYRFSCGMGHISGVVKAG